MQTLKICYSFSIQFGISLFKLQEPQKRKKEGFSLEPLRGLDAFFPKEERGVGRGGGGQREGGSAHEGAVIGQERCGGPEPRPSS